MPFSAATFRRAVERYCTVSLRSLALFRIVLGGAAVYCVLRRWPFAELLYSEAGFYTVAGQGGRAWTLGPLAWVDGGLALHVVFAFILLIALAFTVGAGMRVVRFLLFPALWTLDARAMLAASGSEVVLHLQALYSMALPLAEVWSVDAWLLSKRIGLPVAGTASPEKPASAASNVQSAFYPLLLVQVAAIYVFGYLCKTGSAWRDGTAIAQALNLPSLITPLGATLARAPQGLLALFAYGTLVIEGVLPFLLLSPWARRKTHALAGALMIALHGGIALTMDVGVWGTAMCCFVPLLWHPENAEVARSLPRSARRHLGEALAAAALLYVGAARLTRDVFLLRLPDLPLPSALDTASKALQLRQPWMMFSPDAGSRDHLLIIDAVTTSGQHFDPFRRAALGTERVLTKIPIPSLRSGLFEHYESQLSQNPISPLQYALSGWVFAERPSPALGEPSGPQAPGNPLLGAAHADDPVERFDAWTFVVATRPGYLIPANELESRVGVRALPALGALPVQIAEARGVWAPERAIDGKVVPNGTHVLTPVSAAMSAGCPHLTLDLGEPHALHTALVQADAADQFILEGSTDGHTYERLGEMAREQAMHHLARLVPLASTPVRYVRVRPELPGSLRHFLSEIALFDHAVALPPLPSVVADVESFFSSLDRPSVGGVFSVSTNASGCPAEAPRKPPTRRNAPTKASSRAR